ncbi:serine protease snake [Nilaparvata lugens]|uniref:Trypsin-17 n=1 Tax=Nilaparvata lugens TaxID=108931 RepID=A0A068F4H0_NILLU|nr:serine protease snake [Nilaparvata lugens]AID60351.1 trypsin-17 [Nilaparvata lugens]
MDILGSKILIIFIILDAWIAHCHPRSIDQEECRQFSTPRQTQAMPLLPDIFPFRLKTDLCTRSNPLIVGGTTAEPGEFPHMAALGYQSDDGEIEWLCGGSLISSRFVITAAHCVKSRRGAPQWVQMGMVRLQNTTEYNRRVEATWVYSDYDPPAVYNDIALLKLEQTLVPMLNIRPICLSVPEDLITPDSKVFATGWGRTGYGLDSSQTLLKVPLKMVDDEKCKTYYSADRFLPDGISDRQFCAGPYDNDSQDTCQGDSGGPVQVTSRDNECIQFLVGITSFGKYCGSGTPGVYMKIAPFLPWIRNIVWPTEPIWPSR